MANIPHISEDHLKAGGRLAFISPEPEELYLMEVMYNRQFGMFWIFFDGKLSEHSDFEAMMIQMYDLIADYHLESMQGVTLEKFLNVKFDPEPDDDDIKF